MKLWLVATEIQLTIRRGVECSRQDCAIADLISTKGVPVEIRMSKDDNFHKSEPTKMLEELQSETEHVHRNEMMCVRYVHAQGEVLLMSSPAQPLLEHIVSAEVMHVMPRCHDTGRSWELRTEGDV